MPRMPLSTKPYIYPPVKQKNLNELRKRHILALLFNLKTYYFLRLLLKTNRKK